MCLACGFYNGRQVIDLASAKAGREARIKAKQDRIRVDSGVPEAPAVAHDHDHAHGDEHTPAEKPAQKTRSRKVSSGSSSKKEKAETS